MTRRVEEEVLDSLPSGVLYMDQAGRVRYLNRGAARFLSLSREQAQGAYIRDLFPAFPEPSPPLVREPQATCLTPANPPGGGDRGVVTGRDGHPWQYRSVPISPEDTDFAGTLMVLEKLQPASEPGKAEAPTLSCVYGGKGGSRVGHALNQCLQVLMGCLSLLNLELEANHVSQKYLDKMQDQLEKLRLLALSLSQGGSAPRE